MKTRTLLLNTLLVLIIMGGLTYMGRHRIVNVWHQWMTDPEPEAVTYDQLKNQRTTIDEPLNSNTNTNQPAPVVIPAKLNLAVPFTTQSPDAKWTEQDEESCEEASALIVHYYWQHKTFTTAIAKQELQAIVDFENVHYGKYKDTTAEQTAQFIKDIWGYKRVEVKYDITMDDIKREVAAGRPVILPAAGRMLGNPNFKSPGPLYHMLVVRGWTDDMIITNDPGTRKGEGYQYQPDVLYNAIHDWNDGDVANGRKAIVVVWPND